MSESSGGKRLQVLLAVVGLAVVAILIAVFTGGGEPETEVAEAGGPPDQGGTASSGSGQSIAPSHDHDHGGHAESAGPTESTVLDAGPGKRRVYFPGEGWATVVDDPNADMPPDIDSIPENPNPPEPPPPELPQTARWKLGKTERITEVMTQRVGRLEDRLAEARRGGDQEEARRTEVLLRRTRARIDRLEQEAEELRAQAAEEPSEEEVIRQWEEETGLTVEQLRERERTRAAEEGSGAEPPAPPPESP